MKRWHGLLLVMVVSLGVRGVPGGIAVVAQEMPLPGAAVHSEYSVRQMATSRATPVFPAESVRRGVRGVVVARILTTLQGRMDTVQILQAPEPALGDAVRAALAQWTFPPSRTGPPPNNRRHVVQGKLTFYFEVRNGRGVVLNPDQVEGNTDVWADRAKAAPQPGSGAPAVVRPTTGGFPEVDESEMKERLAKRLAVVVDVRTREDFARDHTTGALNLPSDEVFVRARAELDPRVPIIVDCSRGELSFCRQAGAAVFRTRGFDVSVFLP